jgi:hypothetical protein
MMNRARVAEAAKPNCAVVRAVSACADATKGEVILHSVNQFAV